MPLKKSYTLRWFIDYKLINGDIIRRGFLTKEEAIDSYKVLQSHEKVIAGVFYEFLFPENMPDGTPYILHPENPFGYRVIAKWGGLQAWWEVKFSLQNFYRKQKGIKERQEKKLAEQLEFRAQLRLNNPVFIRRLISVKSQMSHAGTICDYYEFKYMGSDGKKYLHKFECKKDMFFLPPNRGNIQTLENLRIFLASNLKTNLGFYEREDWELMED